jgi:hypothetical protein
MAGGGLMQLVAYGAQDVYLSGNPQITFFKAVYKRHTNFSTEAISQTFSGSPDFGRRVTCPITRNGDLITKMYLLCKISGTQNGSNKWGWAPQVGHALIDNVELEIGGSRIDKQYGDWMNIWYSLTGTTGQAAGYATMIGDTQANQKLADSHADQTLYVPLQFFCCRNNGLALPLISLQYHDVRVNFEFTAGSSCVQYEGATAPAVSMASCELLVDFVFLDSEERKRFAQSSHEYLIEQLQFTGSESVTSANVKTRLNFNHPCKALFWNVKASKYMGTKMLAWSSNAKEMAEKNTITALAHLAATTGNNIVAATVGGVTYEMVKVSGDHAVIANAAGVASLDTSDFVLTGPTLPMSEISKGAASLVAYVGGTYQAGSGVTVNLHNNYGVNLDGSSNPVSTGLLQLNGHDRFSERDGTYFNAVQPFQHFPSSPSDGINVYSFALTPAEHQPSGSCNFSRIDNAQLVLTVDASVTGTLNVYAINYNVLRVMSGMGGLAYSN